MVETVRAAEIRYPLSVDTPAPSEKDDMIVLVNDLLKFLDLVHRHDLLSQAFPLDDKTC